jgi:hypothetical protein
MRRLHNLNLEVILGLLCVAVLVIATQDPFGWAASEPPRRVPKAARCHEAPEKYGGRMFCHVEDGAYGYVNPGSMEWEVE